MDVQLGEKTIRGELVAEDDCTSLAHWRAETSGTLEATPQGMLWDCGAATLMGTVWFDQPFHGPTLVEYDVVTLGGQDNINAILYARAPGGLLETSDQRDGTYAQYQSFQNYIITFLTNGEPEWRIRFRKDPGFHLLTERNVALDTAQNVQRRISYLLDAAGGMELYVDGALLHAYTDTEAVYRDGYHGLRTWNSVLRYSNFRVLRVA
jgi:hypothetical protein